MGKDETKILSPRESAKLIAEHSEDVKIHTEGVDKIAKHVRNVRLTHISPFSYAV